MDHEDDAGSRLQFRRGRTDRDLLGVQLAQDLVASIRRRGLQVGDPIPSEATLAEEYGVSQRVVRDALRALSQQGAIETRQGKRAVVSELRPVAVQGYFELAIGADEGAVDELVALRQVLETKAAGLAASRLTPDDLDHLDQLLATMESPDDPDHRVASDLEFHGVVVRASGNRFFDAILTSLADVLAADRRRGWDLLESQGAGHTEADEEHRAIVAALRSGSAERAEAAMAHHLEQVRTRLSR